MKKLIYSLICVMLMLSMTISAYAEDTDPSQGESTPPASEHVCNFTLTSDTATCTTDGTKTYACSCGESKTESSPAKGHSYGTPVKIDDSKHKSTCGACGAEVEAGHTMDGGTVTTQATCQTEGVKTFTCTGCGHTRTEVIPKTTTHAFGDWTKTDTGHSRKCQHCEEAESGNHKMKEQITKEATCKEDGAKTKTCTVCDYSKVSVIARLTTHTYDHVCDPECNVCGITRTIEHNFTKIWSYNYSSHWHECTKCKEKVDEAKHIPGPAATEEKPQICLVCEYEMMPKKEHVHDYEKEWSSDEAGHWHACKGCDDEEDYVAHSYEELCDPVCSICGYEKETGHTFEGNWQTSEKEHWDVCTVCGTEADHEKHVPGPEATDEAAQLCTICQYEIAPMLEHFHDFGKDWIQAKDSHWQECKCGELSVPEPHDWDEGTKNKNKTMTYTCAVCGAEKTVEAPSSGFPWWIVCVLLGLVCIGGIVAIVIILRRGDDDEEYDDEDYDD